MVLSNNLLLLKFKAHKHITWQYTGERKEYGGHRQALRAILPQRKLT